MHVCVCMYCYIMNGIYIICIWLYINCNYYRHPTRYVVACVDELFQKKKSWKNDQKMETSNAQLFLYIFVMISLSFCFYWFYWTGCSQCVEIKLPSIFPSNYHLHLTYVFPPFLHSFIYKWSYNFQLLLIIFTAWLRFRFSGVNFFSVRLIFVFFFFVIYYFVFIGFIFNFIQNN